MFSLSNWINLQIKKHFRKKFEPATRKVLKEEFYEVFKSNGEGIYYSNLKGRNNSFISRAIAKFSGGLTHSVIMLYSENLKQWFTEDELKKISEKMNWFYGDNEGMTDDIKVIILGSADDDGMNYCDFSRYNTRELSIKKAELDTDQIKRMIRFLLTDKVLDACYDYVGLAFWVLGRIVHSKKDYFCSELVYDAFKHVGVIVAERERPSPKELEDYRKEWLKYTNI